MQLYKAILNGKVEYTRHFSKYAKDLCHRLLQADLSRRLGNLKDGAKDVRTHSWFKGFDFEGILNRTLPAPIKIHTKGEDDTGMFDEWGDEGPDKGMGKVNPEEQKLFAGF